MKSERHGLRCGHGERERVRSQQARRRRVRVVLCARFPLFGIGRRPFACLPALPAHPVYACAFNANGVVCGLDDALVTHVAVRRLLQRLAPARAGCGAPSRRNATRFGAPAPTRGVSHFFIRFFHSICCLHRSHTPSVGVCAIALPLGSYLRGLNAVVFWYLGCRFLAGTGALRLIV